MNKPRKQSKGTVPRGQSVGLCLQGRPCSVCLTSFSLEKPREMAHYWMALKGSTHPGRETAQTCLPYYLNKNMHAHTRVCTHIHILPTPLPKHTHTHPLPIPLPEQKHTHTDTHTHSADLSGAPKGNLDSTARPVRPQTSAPPSSPA